MLLVFMYHCNLNVMKLSYEILFAFQSELVYANYGEEKDFKLLSTKGVSCRDKIVIMRYGRLSLIHI